MSSIVVAVAAAALTALAAHYYLHMFQLESYQLDGYMRWLRKNPEKHMGWTVIVGLGSALIHHALYDILVRTYGYTGRTVTDIIALVIFWGAGIWLDGFLHSTREKKPLVYTARMKRLYAMVVVLAIVGSWALWRLNISSLLMLALIPYLPLIAGALMQPLEKLISGHYLNQAKAILEKRADLIRIGITGSYGKTSTKFILATILSEKYEVLATPASFNTPMGLTRVIREQLMPRHQVFLAEMGARHTGDIKELVDLVRPTCGVLTSVGEQHLETFGSLQAVADTKYELIAGLPQDGAAFFAADGGIVDGLYEKTGIRKFRAGLEGEGLDMRAGDIQMGPEGSRFTLTSAQGEKVECETRLLGKHNIQNIVLACSLAKYLGLTMEEIARGVKRIEPVEHRLQLVHGGGGITVIDDAFNANPVGAKAALEVLSCFPGRRIVVTPGMVEEGEKQAELNREFGRQMAAVCNQVILVGPRQTEPIMQGLIEAGMDKENIHVVAGLEEATAMLSKMGQIGDTVLFENDLPDNYSERDGGGKK